MLLAHCRMITPVAKNEKTIYEIYHSIEFNCSEFYLRFTLAFTQTLLLFSSFGGHETYVDGFVRFVPENGKPQKSFCTLSQCQHLSAMADICKKKVKKSKKIIEFICIFHVQTCL